MLVLSLFPGIGLLDMAFELEGFTVVRGPDVLWGGDVRRFHPPAGRFDGVIGGPPCQCFSSLVRLVRHNGNEPKFGNLIPEFERCIREADPNWFVMEQVPEAPAADVTGYAIQTAIIEDSNVGGMTWRRRRFSFGSKEGRMWMIRETRGGGKVYPAVTCDAREQSSGERIRAKEKGGGQLPRTGKAMPLDEMCFRQGLPREFLSDSPFTNSAKRSMVGNGVPLPMGRAIARAVREAVACNQ